MGKVYSELDARIVSFIERQQLFFVATAPLSGSGLVNLSPKGLASFAVLDPRTVAYQDLVGSGIETVAHLRENGRIVFMFCSFEGSPRILRLHGRGEVVERGDPGWEELLARFAQRANTRCVVRARLTRIADSCGYGVPLFRYEGQRDALGQWAETRGPDGLAAYVREHNAESLDGLPGLRSARP